jgi:hypothetical protein
MGAVATLMRETGARLDLADQVPYDLSLESATSQFDDATWKTSSGEGQAMPAEQAA